MLIAARESFAAAARRWRNPYVPDGLVAMWDGIWNDGGGKHVDTPTLREIVSGDALTSEGTFSVVPNGLATAGSSRFLGAARAINLYNNILGDVTVEILFTPTAFGGGYAVPFYWVADNSHRYVASYGTYRSGTTYLDNGFQIRATAYNSNGAVFKNLTFASADAGKHFRLVGGVSSGSVWRTWYRNGMVVDSASKTSGSLVGTPPADYNIFWAANSFGTVWHSARIYNRALTSSELSANYAIDKERFGLP